MYIYSSFQCIDHLLVPSLFVVSNDIFCVVGLCTCTQKNPDGMLYMFVGGRQVHCDFTNNYCDLCNLVYTLYRSLSLSVPKLSEHRI